MKKNIEIKIKRIITIIIVIMHYNEKIIMVVTIKCITIHKPVSVFPFPGPSLPSVQLHASDEFPPDLDQTFPANIR